MSRREFLQTSAVATGAVATLAQRAAAAGAGEVASALEVPFAIKPVVAGMIHEGAWEGSCRWGDLPNLTFEVETRRLGQSVEDLKARLAQQPLPKGIETLAPVSMHSWAEAGNPEIMFDDAQLEKLAADDPRTDAYMVTAAAVPCLKIARRFKKPVIVANAPGWGLDIPAGLRREGLEGYYVRNWDELRVLLGVLRARKAFAATKLLRVTNFPNTVPSGVISAIPDLDVPKTLYGMDHVTVPYATFFGEMDAFVSRPENRKAAEALAAGLARNAAKNDMTLEELANSTLFFLYTHDVMARHEANAFTIECFELCSSLNPWKRHFTPCLTHALNKDAGLPSACEGDVNALMAMSALMYLSRKSVYMGNPDIDVEQNVLALHHSDVGRRMKGIDEADTPYEIDAFTKSGFGATLRYDFNADKGAPVTAGRFSPCGHKMLVTRGAVRGGKGLDGLGCAQSVDVDIVDARGLLRTQQDFGHHLSLVFGDYVEPLRDLGAAMGFEVVLV
jgi:L-fucose isomerase-like protein